MENFKDITEHQLEVGEVGVYRELTYIALENPSLVDIKCDKCDICHICCPDVVCEFDIYFKRHIVAKKEAIDPILESIDDTSDDDSDPTNICCEHFKTFIPLFSWFTINEDTLIMPNIDNIRVQYCPSCGKYIRDIQLSKRDSLQCFK